MGLHGAERHRQGKTDLDWSSSSPERPDESALSRTLLLPYLANTARLRQVPDQRLFPATLMPDSDWWQALWPNPTAVLRAVGIGAGMGVVDLCCGNGYFTAPMCELVYPGETWALDLDADLLGHATWTCRDQPNFHAVLGDARDLPRLVRNKMDFVFIANTFHGVPNKLDLSRAVYASLKPGGRFAIVNWHRRPREETPVLDQPRGPDTVLRMAPEDVCRVVEPAGFELSAVFDVGPYHYGAVFRRAESI